MPTLPNTGVITPTPGGDNGTWDDKNNAAWSNYDGHRHEDGNGLRIRPAGIDINADLTFNSLYAPIALHRLTFASIVALTSNNKSLFVNTSDNELYWRSNTGTNVKLTAGNALNVAAFTGGFGAGYTSASAAADYDDSTEQYTFKQAAAGAWSRLGVGGIRLYEFGTTETLRVGLLAPAGLAGSYDVTLPLAAPASTQLVQMSSAGVLTASNTIANATTFSAVATFNAAPVLAAGATASSGQTITSPTFLASTAYQHTYTIPISFIVGRQVINFAAGASLANENTQLTLGTSTLPMTLSLVPLPNGYIQSVVVGYSKTSGAGTITVVLKKLVGNTPTTVLTATVSGTPGNGGFTFTPPTTTKDWPCSDVWYLLINGGGTTGDTIISMSATVSNPP
jgi:hypothetical protein